MSLSAPWGNLHVNVIASTRKPWGSLERAGARSQAERR
jgi:hypothetical protein